MTTQDAAGAVVVIFEETIDSGFVFVGSECLSSPYSVQATADAVTVNGRAWPTGLNVRPSSRRGGDARDVGDADRARGGGGDAARFSRNFGGARWTARHLAENLKSNAIVIALPETRPIVISVPTEQHDFFLAVLARDAGLDEFQGIPSVAMSGVSSQVWDEWISEVAMTEEFRARAGQVIEEVVTIHEANMTEIRAFQRLHALAYPLTVLGMILGVAALGHLLKSFSRLENGQENVLPPEVLRATTVSIALMVALSLFDLTWTVLASQAGQMQELNPLGSRLISDPAMLIAFKFAATLVGCGILFALRRHQRARQACWWLCLVCTVLTFRWVMFNSMFIA